MQLPQLHGQELHRPLVAGILQVHVWQAEVCVYVCVCVCVVCACACVCVCVCAIVTAYQ